MKILVVAGWMYPDAEGGSFRAVYESSKGLASRGHDVTVWTQQLNPSLPRYENLDGIHVERYKNCEGNSFKFFFFSIFRIFIKSLLYRKSFDVVYLHHLVSAFGFSLSQFLGKKKPMLYHCYMLRFLEFEDEEFFSSNKKTGKMKVCSSILKWMEGIIFCQATQVVVYSKYVHELIQKYYPQWENKVFLSKPGVDLIHFSPGDTSTYSKQKEILILTTRRLEPRMGIENLITAFGKIVLEFPSTRLTIVGRGSLDAKFREQIKKLNLIEKISLLGWISDQELVDLYRKADLFVLPTRALEGFGFVVLESLSCGTPVLGTPIGAIPEILKEFDEKLIFENETSEAIEKKMKEYLQKTDELRGFREKCRSYVEKNFRWENHIQDLETHMKEIVRI